MLGFAHPGFTMQNFTKENILAEMKDFISRSDGRIKFVEKYHQAYPIGKTIEQEELNQYNKIIDEFGLINMGGRDNHSKRLIKPN